MVATAAECATVARLLDTFNREFDTPTPGTAVLTTRLDVQDPKYNATKLESFRRDVLTNVKAIPGVESAALTLSMPIEGSHWGTIFIVGDQLVPERARIPHAAFNPISPEYIQTMRIPLLKGRVFTEADTEKSPQVVLINETMARLCWPEKMSGGSGPARTSPPLWRKNISRSIPKTIGAPRKS